MKKLIFLMTAIALVCLSVFSVSIALAKTNETPKLKIFVHYPGKGNPKPLPPPNCTLTANDQVNDYGLAGWQMPAAGMTYRINFATEPRNLSQNSVLTAINSSFATWTAADSKQVFNYGGTTTARTAKADGTNAIFWKGISGSAIAITYAWYYPSTGELAEVDTAFNSNLSWSITNPSAGDCAGPTSSYDLQNIGTHEFGHWVGLNDLYASVDKDLTMYGYGERSELKKDSLGAGDINGTLAVAP